jgi:hypothetical protein
VEWVVTEEDYPTAQGEVLWFEQLAGNQMCWQWRSLLVLGDGVGVVQEWVKQ